MYFKLTWDDVYASYLKHKDTWQKHHPGKYLIIHVSTYKLALGDPSQDGNDGYTDAFRNFQCRHGTLWGTYFGILIPNVKEATA